MHPSPHDPDRVTVEAETAEDALSQVHARLGDDARIVAADKVLRGGRWGFFQKEMVQLTAVPAVHEAPAAPASPPEAAPEAVASPEPATAATGLADVLARMSAAEDEHEEGLGTALRRQLGVRVDGDAAWAPPAVDPLARRVAPVTTGEEPAAAPTGLAAALATLTRPEAPAEPRASAPIAHEAVEYQRPVGHPWSGRGLLMLGLPRGLVDAVLAQDPADDAAWTFALARALAPLCRPLPTGAAVMVGPRARMLAHALGVPLARLSEEPRGVSTLALSAPDGAATRAWLTSHRGQRWTHLVVGGDGWRGLVFDEPLAVSWVGDDVLGEAIRTAHDLGLVLGDGLDDDGERQPPTPIELAMRLRDQLGGGR